MQLNSDKLRDSDRQNELLRVRLADCEQIIDKFSEEIRQLEVLIDRKAREQEALDRENKVLKQELDEYRMKDAKYCQVRISLEQES
jgi:predicted RNase H-like nuclease (RuvC/YqgF family)